MSHAAIDQAAAILAGRRLTGEQGPHLPESCRPRDTATALAIQNAVAARLREQVGAWKCGMPMAEGVVLAPIFASNICDTAQCAARARNGHVRIEPELAFVLGRDLPPRDHAYTPAEVDAAIAATHLALELIDSRYADHAGAGYLGNLADGLLNQGLFLGPRVDSDAARTAETLAFDVIDGAGRSTVFAGRHPAAAPRAPLYWLAEFLRGKGQGLRAGQAVITGSYVPSFEVPVDHDLLVRFGSLGELTARFCAK